jgi:hypothetical protein
MAQHTRGYLTLVLAGLLAGPVFGLIMGRLAQ